MSLSTSRWVCCTGLITALTVCDRLTHIPVPLPSLSLYCLFLGMLPSTSLWVCCTGLSTALTLRPPSGCSFSMPTSCCVAPYCRGSWERRGGTQCLRSTGMWEDVGRGLWHHSLVQNSVSFLLQAWKGYGVHVKSTLWTNPCVALYCSGRWERGGCSLCQWNMCACGG